MAQLNPLGPTVTGPLLGAVAAAVGGDAFQNTGREVLYVKNGGVGSINVTVDSPGTCSLGVTAHANHDAVVAVAAGAERVIGPFPTRRFNDSNGNAQITYSGVTSVTVAVLRV